MQGEITMNNRLWYAKPGEGWLEGLPIGNGRLAAMVCGDEKGDKLSLNHEWLWRGVNRYRDNEPVADHLEEVRRVLKEGDFAAGTTLGNQYFGGNGGISGIKGRVDPYQPAGDLYFELDDITQYLKRELDISKGVVTIERLGSKGKITSSFITSVKDNLVFGRWYAEDGTFSGDLSFTRVEDDKAITSCRMTEKGILFECSFDQGIQYQVKVEIKTDGKVQVGKSINIQDAKEVRVAINIATSVKGIEEEFSQYPFQEKEWDELLEDNSEAFDALLGKFKLEVDTQISPLPTDERIKAVKEGASDPGLILLYFHYGRYLLASSSICGELPANLQGKWNDSVAPAWDSDYHFDINLQMNYWMIEKANMGECAEALLKYIERFIPHAQKAAKDLYGCRGILLPIQTDAWGRSTPESSGWAVWIGAAPWIAQHFWWHYIYSGEKAFLEERAYPLFKQIAQFYEDYLVEDEEGVYQIIPSQSPENRFKGTGDWPVSLGVSSAMDVQLAYDALNYAITSAEILDKDPNEREVWKKLKANLPSFKIGEDGRLLEWECEREEEEPGHRHLSHLYGLFPSDLFNPIDRPGQFEAAVKSLNYRLKQGGGHTGWSRAWVACLAARMGNGQQLWEHMNGLIKDFATTTLLDLHPPKIFQIEGNLGAVAAILESLVQTWGGKVHFLRALPEEWKTGRLQGMKVPGGHLLNVEWKDGQLVMVEVTLGYGKQITLADIGSLFELPIGVEKYENDVIVKGNPGESYQLI